MHHSFTRRLQLAAAVIGVAAVLTACSTPAADTGDEGDGGSTQAPMALDYSTTNTATAAVSSYVLSWQKDVTDCTAGAITFSNHWAASLFTQPETLPAIRDGQLDMGLVASTVTPKDLPLFEAAGLPFTGNDPVAMSLAFADAYKNNDIFRAQFEDNNVHMLAFHAIGPAGLFTKVPIKSVDDIKGLKLRATGIIASAYQAIGASPVSVDAAEVYEAVQRGVLDGVGAWPFDNAPSNKFQEVAPYVTDTGLGMYASNGIGISEKVFQSLTPDTQKCMTDAGQKLMEEDQPRLIGLNEAAACEVFKSAGGGVSVLSDAETKDWRADVQQSARDTFVKTAANDGGYSEKDVKSFLDTFLKDYAKYADSVDYVPGMVACAKG